MGTTCSFTITAESNWYLDADGDGFGDSQLPICSAPEAIGAKRAPLEVDLVRIGGDCDDSNPLINPNELELCNGFDDNCNGLVDEGCTVPSTPPTLPTIPVIPLPPAAPLAPEPANIVIPTPLPQSPPPPVEAVIIVQPNVFRSASSATAVVCYVSVVLFGALFALVM